MKVPILFIIFNRPDIAAISFESIREYQPDVLYIAADGPRDERKGEDILCQKTRQHILDMIDWQCDVRTLFRKKNVGVDAGVYGAINWMFETEPWGVIIEDDCIVSQDFYHLCEVAFPKYMHNKNIVHIIANNPMSKLSISRDIELIYYPITWGWATWANKWKQIMDPEMTTWQNMSLFRAIKEYGLLGIMYYKYWNASYRERHLLKPWDNIWQYSVMMQGGLSLLPAVNLAINNGIGTSEGSHYSIGEENFYEGIQMGKLEAPYEFPIEDKESASARRSFNRYFYRLRWFGLKKKLKKLL